MIGVLVNLEGIDGCGKSTQSKLLLEKLEGEGEKVIILKEPTKRPHGQKLWDMLHGKRKATNEEILELFVLDRIQHVEEKIQPALDDGTVILMDRYYYSSMAYQVAGGIDVEEIREKHAFAPKPLPTPPCPPKLPSQRTQQQQRLRCVRATY